MLFIISEQPIYAVFPSKRLVTTDEDNKRLRNDISELKARQRLEIERVVKEKEEEMEEVHKRYSYLYFCNAKNDLC